MEAALLGADMVRSPGVSTRRCELTRRHARARSPRAQVAVGTCLSRYWGQKKKMCDAEPPLIVRAPPPPRPLPTATRTHRGPAPHPRRNAGAGSNDRQAGARVPRRLPRGRGRRRVPAARHARAPRACAGSAEPSTPARSDDARAPYCRGDGSGAVAARALRLATHTARVGLRAAGGGIAPRRRRDGPRHRDRPRRPQAIRGVVVDALVAAALISRLSAG